MGGNQGKDGYESDDAGRDRQYRFAFGSGNHGFSRSADAPQPGTSAGGLGQDAEQSRRRVVYERPSEWQHRNSLAGSADFQIRSIDLAPSSHANGMGACQPQPGTRNPGCRGDQPSLANVVLASRAFARALEIKPWVEMKISQHQLQVAQQRLDQRRGEAVEYAYGLRDQARMTLGDLNYLLLSGKRQEWLASVNNLLGEAEQFFEIYGDDKARSFVHALSANPVQWMVRQ